MGPDPGTRRQILAQGPTAARSASPRGTGVTPNHHIAMLQNRLSAGRRRGFTAVFRMNRSSVLPQPGFTKDDVLRDGAAASNEGNRPRLPGHDTRTPLA